LAKENSLKIKVVNLSKKNAVLNAVSWKKEWTTIN
jgi:uridylate kinase